MLPRMHALRQLGAATDLQAEARCKAGGTPVVIARARIIARATNRREPARRLAPSAAGGHPQARHTGRADGRASVGLGDAAGGGAD